MSKIQRLDNGQLPSIAWPGGYPLFYLTATNSCICPDCANDNQEGIVASDINWEDEGLFCDDCGKKLNRYMVKKAKKRGNYENAT
jgi:hypothetical protein